MCVCACVRVCVCACEREWGASEWVTECNGLLDCLIARFMAQTNAVILLLYYFVSE